MQELMKKNNWSLHCNLCGKDVFKDPLDYFMVKDEIWDKICDNDYIDSNYVLCRHCAEEILGRKFNNYDFTNAPINYIYGNGTTILKNEYCKKDNKS